MRGMRSKEKQEFGGKDFFMYTSSLSREKKTFYIKSSADQTVMFVFIKFLIKNTNNSPYIAKKLRRNL